LPHFTYASVLDSAQLRQGDLLRRTQKLEDILRDVHPHYFKKPDYRFFIVLTQSCDLVRRDDKRCASPYITIAAVRPVKLALEREVRRIQYDEVEEQLGFCDESRKAKLVQFLERLLNNNEDRYFFLYREPLKGLDEDHCAFLQLSIALKAELHYSTLLAAKVLQLNDSFQHKLGYLVGTSYSRVGTDDWLPNHATKEKFEHATRQPIDDLKSVTWLEGPIHKEALKRLRALPSGERSIEKLEEVIKEVGRARDAKRLQVLDTIAGTLKALSVDAEVIQRARARLESDPSFRANIR
jgi:hypothetical protein